MPEEYTQVGRIMRDLEACGFRPNEYSLDVKDVDRGADVWCQCCGWYLGGHRALFFRTMRDSQMWDKQVCLDRPTCVARRQSRDLACEEQNQKCARERLQNLNEVVLDR